MRKLDRRDFLKIMGLGAGAAAIIATGNRDNLEPGNRQNTQATASRSAILDAVANQIEGWESQFSDFMTIVADERSNALIVSGTITDLSLIENIISEIDIVLAQVRIDVIITAVRLRDFDSRGIDSFGFEYDTLTGEILSFDAGFPGIGIIGNPGAAAGEYVLDVVFDEAGRNEDVDVLSAPTIVTTHNKEATIIVAESRPIITSSSSGGISGVETRSTFQFQDIGITLKVKPLIGPNDVIQMEIDQTIDDINGQVEIDGNEQPVIARRQATSFVSVRSQEMIVLGGLRQTEVRRVKKRIGLLGQVPIIAPLFTNYEDEDITVELIVFIRPSVIRNTDEANVDAQERLTKVRYPDEVQSFIDAEPILRAGEGMRPEETGAEEEAPNTKRSLHKK